LNLKLPFFLLLLSLFESDMIVVDEKYRTRKNEAIDSDEDWTQQGWNDILLVAVSVVRVPKQEAILWLLLQGCRRRRIFMQRKSIENATVLNCFMLYLLYSSSQVIEYRSRYWILDGLQWS